MLLILNRTLPPEARFLKVQPHRQPFFVFSWSCKLFIGCNSRKYDNSRVKSKGKIWLLPLRGKKALWIHTWLETKRLTLALVYRKPRKATYTYLSVSVTQVGWHERNEKTVRNARYIGGCVKIRKHHAHHRCVVYMGLGKRQGLGIMLGSFSCFRPGLTLCMHTIYARRKSFFQPPKGLLNSLW